jgi:hypothetical protein
LTRVRRRRGSGKDAKNFRMLVGERREDIAIVHLNETGEVLSIIRLPLVFFKPPRENGED